MDKSVLAVDVGGTKIRIGEVTTCGEVLQHKRYESKYGTQRDILQQISESVTDYSKTVGWLNGRPSQMGVGLIGRTNPHTGTWLQIDGTRNEPIELASILADTFQMPCKAANDVKAATLAEQRWGYGRSTDNFIYLNVGTGIAAGSVVNGRLIWGGHYNAGEVGHITSGVDLDITCGCGRKNCVEPIASGLGIDRCARLLAGQYATSLVIPDTNDARVDVAEVYRRCQQGDELCQVLVNHAATGLANLIMNLIRVTDPDTVVLGGGVVADGFMLGHIQEKLNKHTIRFVSNGIVLTQLDAQLVGLLGAGAVALGEANL